MDIVKAPVTGQGMRLGLVCARFNQLITDRLLAGALDTLERCGVADGDLTVVWVPGSFEVPLAAKTLAAREDIDAVVTLGAVIRGETGHYDLVAGLVAAGVARASLDTGTPVVFGVLTTDTLEQALDRAGAKAGNKGAEAAATAIEMVHVLRALKS
jgi:6,7-dimethyl-8-ribityllumazine synthase